MIVETLSRAYGEAKILKESGVKIKEMYVSKTVHLNPMHDK